MSHVFYDHLLPWEKINAFLLSLDISSEERHELLELIEEALHTEVLTVICTYLPREKHEEFIVLFHEEPHHEKHMHYLREHASSDVRIHIKSRSEEIVDELLEHLRKGGI